ncbi:hypothetical protein Y10_03600 [Neptunitalea sp. Y10]|uniref:DUF2225 domain-containing protein n=2 Tax=Neptunitalea lumnitzerae TaxID=2965509 RepID=A0ABQ5MF51_9FLAO|nr:hypothetical protein Y10_03600 [Neptunitalea sp. Y10]
MVVLYQVTQAHTCDPRIVRCPIDNKKVEFCVTMSMSTFGSYYDFQKTGAIGNHYEQLINSCPKCHFSGFLSDFEKDYSNAEMHKLTTFLEKYKNIAITDAKECEIAAEIKAFLNEPNDAISNCYLLGSYLVRSETTKTEYRILLQQNTCTYLLKAIDAKEYEDKKVATIYYLIGEMYRRTADFDNAINYYNQAIANENKQEWIEQVANQMKDLALKKDADNNI